MILLVSPVNAGLSILASSEIDFLSNDPNLRGEAFQILVTENGGSERIYFNDLEPDAGYDMKSNSGYIKAEADNIKINYPYKERSGANNIYRIIALNDGNRKWFLTQNLAQGWCKDLTSGEAWAFRDAVSVQSSGYYKCYTKTIVGTLLDIDLPQYKWEENFEIFNPLTNEKKTLKITDSSRTSFLQTDNGKVLIKYAFTGDSVNSALPQLSNGYDVFQTESTSHIINKFDSSETDPYESLHIMETFFSRVLGKQIDSNGDSLYDRTIDGKVISLASYRSLDTPDSVMSQINNELDNYLERKFISQSGWTVSSPKDITSTAGVITMTKNDNDLPKSPVFTIKIDAEWIGVFKPVGKPVLVDFKVKNNIDEYAEGDTNAIIVSEVRNDATVSASFNYVTSCTPSNQATIKSLSAQAFDPKETKFIEHEITGATNGEDLTAECCLTVVDSEGEVTSTQKCEEITFFERNTCPTGMVAGDTTCGLSGSIMECKANDKGRLVLQPTSTVCPYGCSLLNNRAVCNQNPTCDSEYGIGKSCGDGVCESFEGIGKDCECKEDCSTCGDDYCSAKEKESGTCPKDCGSELNTDDIIQYAFLFFGVSVLIGALYIRGRQEGWWK